MNPIKRKNIATTGCAQLLLIFNSCDWALSQMAFEQCTNGTMADKKHGLIGYAMQMLGHRGNNPRLRVNGALPAPNGLIRDCKKN